jgi:hypothetical protein
MVAFSQKSAQTILRASGASRVPLSGAFTRASSRRLVSTSTAPKKSGSWKGTFARWGLAGGAVYYYNTSPVFAQTPGRKCYGYKHCAYS